MIPFSELAVDVLPGLRGDLICAYEGEVLPEARMLRVEDGGWTAWGVISGCVQVKVWSKNQTARLSANAGEWFLCPALPREHVMTPGTSLLSLRFRLERENGLPVFSLALPVVLGGVNGRALADSGRSFLYRLNQGFMLREDRSGHEPRKVEGAPMDIAGQVAMRAGFLEWMSVFIRTALAEGWMLAGETRPSLVASAMAILQRFDPAPDGSIEAVSKKLSTSVSHLRRKFQEVVGTAPSVWRDRQRLEVARIRLRNTEEPVKSLAWALGFANAAHFSAWFRKQTGLCPTDFRSRKSSPGV